MSMSARRQALNVAAPLVFGIAVLVLWEQFVNVQDIKPSILPTPSSIWRAGGDKLELLWKASKVSGTNAFVGLVLGILVGCFAAMIANRFRLLSELIVPLSAAISAVPIVVVVTIMSKMFGATSEVPRRLMTMIVVFFVVFVNVARGLGQSDSTQVELMRSYAANGRQVMRKVRLPNAMPFLFTAIKISAPLAVTTAFVSEYFGGAQNGLGYKIPAAMTGSKFPLGWAYVGAACVLGLAFFVVANVLEFVAVPWQRRRPSS